VTTRLLARVIVLCAAAALVASCVGIRYRYATDKGTAALTAGAKPGYPAARFAVLSDPHLYDASLGIEGPAFAAYMADDRKLLPESEEILTTAMGMVESQRVEFLLIPGDLTKDGERQDHELMARHLAAFAQDGITIYVVPGNHDIENPHSMRFTATGAEPIPRITPEDFTDIYRDFGYGDALFRDPASPSYVAEPVDGLWLLALASSRFMNNGKRTAPETDGGFTPATVSWIEDVLAEALSRGKAVIAMMHHGILEHYKGEKKYFHDFVVDDFQSLSAMFAAYGVRVVFTGHYHAQDITRKNWDDGKFLYDIETGSLVSAPDPIRIVEIQPSQRMSVKSLTVDQLPSFEAQGRDFKKYSEDFEYQGISGIAVKIMKSFGVPAAEAEVLAPQISDAVMAHYKGDERFTGIEMLKTSGLSLMGGLVVGSRKDFVTGLWTDLEPADNDITVDLSTGAWESGE
jgi:UDP-2,3-diacylglucosamine pyrophosphatase LpxH